MKKHKPIKRSLAMALSMVMVLGAVPIPVSANILPSDHGMEITAFEPLAEEIEYQSVPIGTKIKDLDLPKKLMATVEVTTAGENPSKVVEEPVEIPTNETPTDGGSQEPVESQESKEPQEPQESQTPQETGESNESEIPDATSSNAFRAASVRVDSFDENDSEITDVEETQVVEKVISIPVTWNADPEFESDVAGDYTFEPTIPDEYVIANGVDMPTITVSVGNMMLRGGNGWYERTEVLDLTANSIMYRNGINSYAGANPLESDITITGEGWYWYLDANEDEGYPEKTLVLDGINFNIPKSKSMILPVGTTIVLKEGSDNILNNLNNNAESMSVGITGTALSVKGTGELHINVGTTSSYGSIGINSFTSFDLEDAGLYINVLGTNNNKLYTLRGPSQPNVKAFQKWMNDDYSFITTWDASREVFTYNAGNTIATDVKLLPNTLLGPSATISDKTVSGGKGKVLSGENDVVISILNDTFIELQENDDVSSWFSNLPAGITATVKSVTLDSVTIAFSGTPTALSNEVMNITIPTDYLTNGDALQVTVNNNAKFNITGTHTRTSTLDLTGEVVTYVNTSGNIAYASPIDNDIMNTSEGWTWYLNGDSEAGYPEKTLVLDGIMLQPDMIISSGIMLPNDTTIVLADGSYNTVTANNIVIYGKGNITFKGSGELFLTGTDSMMCQGISCKILTIEDGIITALAPTGSYSYGIIVDSMNMTGGTLYAKSSKAGSSCAAYFKVSFPGDVPSILQKVEDEYSEAVRNIEGKNYYVYGIGFAANDLQFTVPKLVPTASVGSKVVSGMTDTALSGQNLITVILQNEIYNNLNEGEDVSGWFQNLPKGIIASVERINSNASVTIAFTGTPIKQSAEAMNIIVPADKLTSNKALTVASNSDARFDIVQAGVRTTTLDLNTDSVWYRNLNGEYVNKNPMKDDINDTAEGWAWYRSHHELILDGINLITTDSVGITLPEATRVFLADKSNNNINILNSEGDYSIRGILGVGDVEMDGNTGRLHITAGNTNGSYSVGIHALGSIYITGGEITSIAGDSYFRSLGIASDSGIDFTGGTIYAKSSSTTDINGIATAIHARYGITDEGMEAFQKVEGEYIEPAIVRNNGNTTCNYVFAGDNIASEIRLTRKGTINNVGGSANITFNGTTIDLKQLSPLFTVDKNAGNRIYEVEEGGTGTGTISGTILTVTKAGTIRISLATEKTQTHPAGAKVFALLTVNKGEKASTPANLSVVNATKNGGNDGKITGLNPNTKYEYKKDGASYQEVTANERGEITGLSSGSYVVRFAENELFGASSDSLAIIIGQPNVDNGGSNGGNNGGNTGGNSDSGSGDSTTNGSSSRPIQAVTGSAQSAAEVDSKGNAVVSVSDKNITDAIANARANAAKKGVNAGDITASIHVTTGGMDASAVTVNLPKNIQQQVISNKISSVELMIDRPDIILGINLAAVTEINKQANADVQLTAKKVDPSTLSAAAKNQISSRPTYDLKASYDGGAKNVSNFGAGSVFVSIPYAPASEEAIGGLYAVYVDEQGNPARVDGSAYDSNSKSLIFKTNHFSVYGLGYESPVVKSTDISAHWAKDSIDYVVGRGLISGVSGTGFAPDNAITREVMATALGKLAAIDVNAYTNNSFADVKADNRYRPYIEWANEKGIIPNKGNNQFAPDQTVSREEVAAILTNYAKAIGYKLPEVRIAETFADAANIGSGYKDAVTAMQKAGIIMGKDGSNFNPKAQATRGEVSSMLHRYIKLTIDPATTQNWAKDDSGQYRFYQDGKSVTGWQTIKDVVYYFSSNGIMVSGKWLEIQGNWYYFNTDGSLAKSTKVDGYEVDEKGVRK